MNAIIAYVKSLLPVYERRDVLAVLTQLQTEHADSLMPVVTEMRALTQGHEFTSKLYARYAQALRKHVNSKQAPMELLLQSLERIQGNFVILEKEIRANLGVQVATAGITYDSVNLLRYLDSVAFYIRYARKFMLKVIADESAVLGGTPPNWVRAELEFLDKNLGNFAGLFNAMFQSEAELKQTFRKTSTAVVDEATADLAIRSLGNQKIDPMQLANFTPQDNYIFSIGKAITEWQVNRYRAAKADLAALEMRLQEMRELRDAGKASPKMQKLIVELEKRVEKIDAKIASIEEDARVEREF